MVAPLLLRKLIGGCTCPLLASLCCLLIYLSPCSSTGSKASKDEGSGSDGKKKLFRTFASLTYYLDTIKKIQFREEHKCLLGHTAFAHLQSLPPIKIDRFLLEDVLSLHKQGDVFCLAGIDMRFSGEDAALITGLPYGGERIPLFGNQVKPSALTQWFGNEMKTDRQCVLEMLKLTVSSTGKEDVETTVRLWIVYMLACFIAPLSNNICPRWFLHYVDDLAATKRYSWANAVRNVIMHKVEEAANVVKRFEGSGRSDAKSTLSLLGFTHVLGVSNY